MTVVSITVKEGCVC